MRPVSPYRPLWPGLDEQLNKACAVSSSTIILAKKRIKGMKGRVKWVEGMSFVGESNSGHAVVMDGPPEFGGRNLGLRPMEMVLLGMGGCTAFDVVSILKKKRQAIVDCVAELEAERAATEPKVFTKIHVHFIVKGHKLDPQAVQKAIELSAEKYCSASIMLAKTATITHDFEVLDVDVPAG